MGSLSIWKMRCPSVTGDEYPNSLPFTAQAAVLMSPVCPPSMDAMRPRMLPSMFSSPWETMTLDPTVTTPVLTARLPRRSSRLLAGLGLDGMDGAVTEAAMSRRVPLMVVMSGSVRGVVRAPAGIRDVHHVAVRLSSAMNRCARAACAPQFETAALTMTGRRQ